MKSKNLNSIEYLRGIASIMVVILHVSMLIQRKYDSTFYFKIGNGGVDLFFIISGFIMLYMNYHNFAKGKSIEFIKKRIIRIVPLYWIYTTLFMSLLYFLPQVFGHNLDLNEDWIFKSFFFLPVKNPDGNITPLLNIGWTLNYEMYFYVLFSIFLIFNKLFLLLLPILFIYLSLLNSDQFYILYYSNKIILEFIFGMIIALLYLNKIYFSKYFSYFIIFVGICIIMVLDANRVIRYGIPYALIVYASLSLEQYYNFSNRFFIYMGKISYSLYLSHIFTISVLGKIVHNVPLLVGISIVSSIVVAHISYKYIEKPLIRHFNGNKK